MNTKSIKNKIVRRIKSTGKGLGNIAKSLNPLLLVRAVLRFFRNAYGELRTVSWLSRKDTVKFSIYILLFLVLSAITIAALDLGLYKLVTFITTSS
jgi:preprotein translocase SecE subunit